VPTRRSGHVHRRTAQIPKLTVRVRSPSPAPVVDTGGCPNELIDRFPRIGAASWSGVTWSPQQLVATARSPQPLAVRRHLVGMGDDWRPARHSDSGSRARRPRASRCVGRRSSLWSDRRHHGSGVAPSAPGGRRYGRRVDIEPTSTASWPVSKRACCVPSPRAGPTLALGTRGKGGKSRGLDGASPRPAAGQPPDSATHAT
jgi:hypothetical protein